jgi:chemotaxis protein methyltransferase CheR
MDEFSGQSEDLENQVAALLQDIYRKFRLDYRNYSLSFLGRRTEAFAKTHDIKTFDALAKKLLSDETALELFAASLSLPTTRMFRDEEVFKQIRASVIPYLTKTQLDKVWCAGCSTGEEAYSLAIILKEELEDRKVLTFATDFSERSLHKAEKGIYSLRRMRAYTSSYMAAGGRADFSDYYSSDDENAIMNAQLKRNIVFAQHNLVTDSTFNEFDLILCRNVLIYFNKQLQEHVLSLLFQSLRPGGILVLGDKESLRTMIPRLNFAEVDHSLRIYRRSG